MAISMCCQTIPLFRNSCPTFPNQSLKNDRIIWNPAISSVHPPVWQAHLNLPHLVLNFRASDCLFHAVKNPPGFRLFIEP